MEVGRRQSAHGEDNAQENNTKMSKIWKWGERETRREEKRRETKKGKFILGATNILYPKMIDPPFLVQSRILK